ncbi:MAG: hypothetical protein Q9186_005967, partial [Xanthomendoza sp. 1 TL-2023]
AIGGHHGVATWVQKPDYQAYKSPHGPNYQIRPNFHGIGAGRAMKLYEPSLSVIHPHCGITAGSFGVVGATFVLFFFADVPKVRTDIMQVSLHLTTHFVCGARNIDDEQKLPLVGDYFVREIPPSDNPF